MRLVWTFDPPYKNLYLFHILSYWVLSPYLPLLNIYEIIKNYNKIFMLTSIFIKIIINSHPLKDVKARQKTENPISTFKRSVEFNLATTLLLPCMLERETRVVGIIGWTVDRSLPISWWERKKGKTSRPRKG